MSQATQFCVGLENKPGVLASLCAAIQRADVKIAALFVSDDEDFCWVTDCLLGDGFECTNGVCWAGDFVCDGVDDCGDCSDEQGCM